MFSKPNRSRDEDIFSLHSLPTKHFIFITRVRSRGETKKVLYGRGDGGWRFAAFT